VKSSIRRWAGHIARMGTGEVHTGFWWGDPREGKDLEDLGVDRRIILKWILKSGMGKHGLD
jgi:hypothetical protein